MNKIAFDFDNFIPNPPAIGNDPEYIEKIRLARKIVLNKVLATDLTYEQKLAIANRIDLIKYRPLTNNEANRNIRANFVKIAYNYEPNQDRTGYMMDENGKAIIKNIEELNEIALQDFAEVENVLHEMYHAASAELAPYIGFEKEIDMQPNTITFKKGKGLNEGIVSYLTNQYKEDKNDYLIITTLLTEILKDIDENLVFKTLLTGDGGKLAEAITTKYQLDDGKLVAELFGQFDIIVSDLKDKSPNKKTLFYRGKCLSGVACKTLEVFGQMFTNKEIKNKNYDYEKIYYDLLDKTDFDSVLTACLFVAKDSTNEDRKAFFTKANAKEVDDVQFAKEDFKERLKLEIEQATIKAAAKPTTEQIV